VRCNRALPSCERCRSHHLECFYPHRQPRHARSKTVLTTLCASLSRYFQLYISVMERLISEYLKSESKMALYQPFYRDFNVSKSKTPPGVHCLAPKSALRL